MLPSLDELIERSHVVALPMRVPFRGITTREALLIEGPAGWGEFSPFKEYGAAEAANWLACGLEMAYQGPPELQRDKVEVNGTIPAIRPERVPELLERYPGCMTVKVKVAEKGHTLAQDRTRVEAVRVARPGVKIRIDANMGWTIDQAEEAAKTFGPLDYLEQPCATLEELKELRTRLQRQGIFQRVAADESIRKAEDPYRVVEMRAADVGVVKAAPLGGVRRLLAVAKHLRSHGMDVTVSSALDTAVGLNAGIAAVAALPTHDDDELLDVPPAPAGLGTGSLFLADVAEPRALVEGFLSAAPVTPDPARLAELKADAATTQWWIDRLRATHEELARRTH
ncbi:L-Ala-D/L-Glu epimerase [Corynebacterium kalinowskii]|uniref:o-succinylbenzoate synthase n=1 Tax=Corynebacterium kalinowskii TaxID=2675216 RepID=A0A6B8VND5_9CORY|nr:o-succinylbenzoate synthase [Corynebacterium kalinowskii]QGU02924.1 L-Ala-D/L-Glu epimerase [Corynebacterium kalinowskii]